MSKTFLTVVLVCLAVAGCGGGGGGPQILRPDIPGDATRFSSWDLPGEQVVIPLTSAQSGDIAALETFYDGYFSNAMLREEFDLVNLGRAYANIHSANGAAAVGRAGNESVIGFIDTGLDWEHPYFEGKRVSVDYFEDTFRESDLADVNEDSHGTSVAGIAAGRRVLVSVGDSEVFMTAEGVAPGANIRMFAIQIGSAPPEGIAAPTEDELINADVDNTGVFSAALDSAPGVDVLNMSFGIPGNVEDYSEETLRAAFGGRIRVFAQEDRPDSEKTILVWSAGNGRGDRCRAGTPGCMEAGGFNGSSPHFTSALQARIPELRGHGVTVIATDSAGVAAEFSNRCGIAAEWCIAAPGEDVWTAYSRRRGNGEISRVVAQRSGTSFSAPIVAGGLALMKQRFRGQLGGVQLLSRMFETANKSGIYAPDTKPDENGVNTVSSIYGQGLLDLGAATEPVGTVGMPTGGAGFVNNENTGQFSPVSGSQIETAQAFGDGVARAFSGREIAGFDSLGAPFWYPLENFAVKTEKSVLHRQLIGFMDFSSGETVNGNDGFAPLFSGNYGNGQNGFVPLFPDNYGNGRNNFTPLSVNNYGNGRNGQSGFTPLFAGGDGNGQSGFAPLFSGNYGNGENNGSAVSNGTVEIPAVYVSMAGAAVNGEYGRLNKSGHLSFLENPVFVGTGSGGWTVSAFTSGERNGRPAKGAVVSHRLPGLPIDFRSGYISEENSALGAAVEGAFGELSAQIVFAGVRWDYKIGDWQIVADAEAGIASPETAGGLVNGVSQLKTSSFSAGVVRRFSGGSALRFSVSSPLRVESGRMGFSIPTGRTPEGVILRETVAANLEPSGRQLDFMAQLVAQTRLGRLSFGTVASREPGHEKNAETALSLLAGYRAEF